MLRMFIRKVFWPYRLLYYRCYRFSQATNGRFSFHYANAALGVMMLFGANVMAVFGTYALVTWHSHKAEVVIHKPHFEVVVVSIAIGLAIIHMMFLQHNNRYKRILSEFANESTAEQRKGDWWFKCYVAVSVLSLLGLAGAFLLV